MNEEYIMEEINYLKRKATLLEKMITKTNEGSASASKHHNYAANDVTKKEDASMFSRTSIC